MKETKFRAWDKVFKKMLYLDGFRFLGKETIELFITGEKEYPIENINDIELLQFTNLKDKNGKEIFDGYIVEFEYKGKEKQKGETIFIGGSFKIKSEKGIYYLFCKEIMKNVEVIGNIYDNPKLLEDKK